MNTSSLSFDSSSAQQKGASSTQQKGGAMATASGYLNKACIIGTVASFVFPPAAPLTGAVCAAGAISRW